MFPHPSRPLPPFGNRANDTPPVPSNDLVWDQSRWTAERLWRVGWVPARRPWRGEGRKRRRERNRSCVRVEQSERGAGRNPPAPNWKLANVESGSAVRDRPAVPDRHAAAGGSSQYVKYATPAQFAAHNVGVAANVHWTFGSVPRGSQVAIGPATPVGSTPNVSGGR